MRLLSYDTDVCTWRTVCKVCSVQSCVACQRELNRPTTAAGEVRCLGQALPLWVPVPCHTSIFEAMGVFFGACKYHEHDVVCSPAGASSNGTAAQPSGALHRPTIKQSVVVENPPSLDQDGNEVSLIW